MVSRVVTMATWDSVWLRCWKVKWPIRCLRQSSTHWSLSTAQGPKSISLSSSFETFLTFEVQLDSIWSILFSLNLAFSCQPSSHQGHFNSFGLSEISLVFFVDPDLLDSFLVVPSQHLHFCISNLGSHVFPLSFGDTSWPHLHFRVCYIGPFCLEPLPLYLMSNSLMFLVIHILVTMMDVGVLLKQAKVNKMYALKW
jgi:hypothetical protein